ncbi:MAG: hypothetical protein M1829_004361 [Trizodia sp. TS-e1964]|nr:MAG: hypothetical protein M1829_004361 [Trizodia sp. TS-e1964]
MSSHSLLEAHTADRKARLAQLKSLKRKQASSHEEENDLPPPPPSAAELHLSGRNYSVETRGPKLGFEHAPTENETTLEDQAREIAQATAAQQRAEEAADRPIDLFKLQPKKPNWDLKRDLERRLAVLNVRTDNAIRRMVVQRVKGLQQGARAGEDGDALGMEGVSFVEGVHVREREEMEERRQEEEDEL